jgi:shikimate kinase
MAPRAVLIGLPGSGKSTIGRRLAKALDVTLLDTDTVIVETTGRAIADIFANDGEPEFRRIEEEVVRAALASHDGVLSLGGGAITTPGVQEALAGHMVIYLEISAAEGVRRTSGNTTRPLLAGADRAEKYRTLMVQRAPIYRRVSTMRVNTNRRNPGAVVRSIVARLENPQSPKSVSAKPRRRRRPPWRRGPAPPAPSETDTAGAPVLHTDATPIPTPAAVAARNAERHHD